METSNEGSANVKDVLVSGVRDLTDKGKLIHVHVDVTLLPTWNQIVILTFFSFSIHIKKLK